MNKHPSMPLGSITRVIKQLDPQAPGTRRRATSSGEQLVCLSCRVDNQRQRRLTSTVELMVELMVDEAPTMNSVGVGLRVAWGERDLRHAARAATGTWDPNA